MMLECSSTYERRGPEESAIGLNDAPQHMKDTAGRISNSIK